MKSLIKKLLVIGGFAAGAAHAGLVGNTATCSIDPSFWSCSSSSQVIADPAPEFQLLLGSAFFSLDFNDDSLVITQINGGGLGMGAGEKLVLGGLLGATGILGMTTAGAVSGFEFADLMFTGGTLEIILNGSSWQPSSSATITFSVPAAAVPEPGSLALLGLGLIGLAASRKRKQA